MVDTTSKIFQPIQVGAMQLQHRVVMAPMTRLKATPGGVPLASIVKEYYAQRGSTPGTFIVGEGTTITAKAGGIPFCPGIYSNDQIAAWKEVIQEVHNKGSFIYIQIAALGRVVFDPTVEAVAPSEIPVTGGPTPRPLTTDEIKEYPGIFAAAAVNAVQKAGADGVEIHGTNGFLIDEFLQDVSNKRTDEYGGSIENRSKFALEVLDAVTKAVGQERVGFRVGPWSLAQDMGMKDPVPTFTYLVQEIKTRFPNLAYLHVIEPRVNGIDAREVAAHESNDFLRDIWSPKPFISGGGYDAKLAIEVAENKGDLIAFGRHFLATPDLPIRLKAGAAPNAYDRSTFYVAGESTKGYIDYPFETVAA